MGFPSDICGASVQFCAVRIARLDGDGVPNPGAGNLYVTDAQITLTFTPVISEGDDLEQKNGCGDVCVTVQDRDRIKSMDLELAICRPDPEVSELLAGGDLLSSGGDTIGYAFPEVGSSGNEFGVSIEGWTKHWVDGAADTANPYWRWVFGRTFWTLGPRTMENGIMTSTFTGFANQNANFHNGPANDLPWTYLGRLLEYGLDTDIPDATCGALTLAAS